MARPERARRRPIRLFYVLLALPTLLVLLALELIGRRLGFEAETWSRLDDELGWVMREPSARFPAEPASLLLLGDSITYEEVRGGPAFGRILRDRGHGVLNLSAIGYGTDQEYLLLRRHLHELPTVEHVVLNFSLFNDVVDNTNRVNPHDGFRRKPRFALEGGRLALRSDPLDFGALDHLGLFLRQRSAALFALRRLAGSLALLPERRPDPDEFRFEFTGGQPGPEALRAYRARLAEGQAVTRALVAAVGELARDELGARFALLLHPSAWVAPRASPFALSPEMAELFAWLPYPAYDLGCHYRASGLAWAEVSYDRPGHLTRNGHRVVAGLLSDYLARGELGRPDCRLGGSDPGSSTR